MKQAQELMAFQYRALFQALDIRFTQTQISENQFKILCEANVKLPVLKKKYQTSTEFLDELLNWQTHCPVSEAGSEERTILKTPENQNSLEPVGFFMILDQQGWNAPEVTLLIGNKQIVLEVIKIQNGYQVQRKDKDQKLIVRKNEKGIEKIEIPVPVIGAVTLERVFK